MSVSKAVLPKHNQNPLKNLRNLKNIAFIEFLEFFWTKCILFNQNRLNITQDMSQNAKIAFLNFLPDFSQHEEGIHTTQITKVRKLQTKRKLCSVFYKNQIPI